MAESEYRAPVIPQFNFRKVLLLMMNRYPYRGRTLKSVLNIAQNIFRISLKV